MNALLLILAIIDLLCSVGMEFGIATYYFLAKFAHKLIVTVRLMVIVVSI